MLDAYMDVGAQETILQETMQATLRAKVLLMRRPTAHEKRDGCILRLPQRRRDTHLLFPVEKILAYRAYVANPTRITRQWVSH